MKAKDLLKKGESAILIRTDGRNFFINSQDSSGSTGFWRIDVNRQVHKVIIYKQDKSLPSNEVYIADKISIRNDGLKRVISLANIQSLGSITEDWYKFSDSKRGARFPIRYLVG